MATFTSSQWTTENWYSMLRTVSLWNAEAIPLFSGFSFDPTKMTREKVGYQEYLTDYGSIDAYIRNNGASNNVVSNAKSVLVYDPIPDDQGNYAQSVEEFDYKTYQVNALKLNAFSETIQFWGNGFFDTNIEYLGQGGTRVITNYAFNTTSFKGSGLGWSYEGTGNLTITDNTSPYVKSAVITVNDKTHNDAVSLVFTNNIVGQLTLNDGVNSITAVGNYGSDISGGSLENGSDIFIGDSLNDAFVSSQGNDVYYGKEGIDSLYLNADSAIFTVLKTGLDDAKITRNGSYFETLNSVERLHFSDTHIALDTEGATSAGGIYRLYQATFARTPDKEGYGFWLAAADNGLSAKRMAEDFTMSAEFQSLYGVNTTDPYFTGEDVGAMITGFYNNILGRDPDQSGYDFWVGVVEDKSDTVGGVLTGFSESEENYNNTIGTIQNGMQYDLWVG